MQQQMKQLQAMQRDSRLLCRLLSLNGGNCNCWRRSVEVTVNGNKEITKLVIDRDVVNQTM